ncbi:hypothetical protein NGM37_11230, partial [Streptomyces sp. TRM76130]|nr:hypothetical protein [Streptomyces sp. TRM76130]
LQHRIAADVTYLITVRSGHRNVFANTVGYGPSPSVTLAVDVPRGVQFLMTESQLRRDRRWMGGVEGLPADVPPADRESPPLPSRYVRDGTLGLATVTSVTELAPAATSGTDSTDSTNNDTAGTHGSGTTDSSGPAEQRGRLHDEVRQLVDRFAPGVTTPGHASYLPGVATLIADHTSVSGKRALIGRGGREIRFSFRHHRFGGASLIEVTLSALPTTSVADRATR